MKPLLFHRIKRRRPGRKVTFSHFYSKTGSYIKPLLFIRTKRESTRKESDVFTFLLENWLTKTLFVHPWESKGEDN
jgi:hypothetical protein